MKASSFLFQSIAPPVTVFGLPPLLVALLIGAAIPFAPIFTLTGLGWMSLLGPLLIFIMGAVFLWRLRRREPHCETVYFMPQRFFKGRRTRTLVVGTPGKPLSK